MDFQEFKTYVAKAISWRTGISEARAAYLIEKSDVAELLNGRSRYAVCLGPDYWAERILQSQ